MEQAAEKLEQLAAVVKGHSSCLIMSHNNPDPDAIASAVLLKRLFHTAFGLQVVLSFGGVVGRAENQELVRYTREDFTRFSRTAMSRVDFVALVDTQPEAGNNPITPEDKPVVVFDHHRIKASTRSAPFFLVRSDVGATVTLVYRICAAAKIEIDARLATIISYALQSETSDLQKEASALDVALYNEMLAIADKHALHEIRYPKLTTDYFVSIHTGIEEAVLYGDVIITPLGDLTYPDVIAEVAEYFLRYQPVHYSIVLGVFREELLFSVRSTKKKENLGTMAQRVVADIGTAGGHDTMAGGQIPLAGKTQRAINGLQKTIIDRFLKELKAEKRKPVQLLKRLYKDEKQ